MAASAASTPLSVRARACSIVSQVRIPNPIGTPDSTAERGEGRAPPRGPRTSWCVVSPRTIAASATTAWSGRRPTQRARAGGDLERARHAHDGDVGRPGAAPAERVERRGEHGVGDGRIPARADDADAQSLGVEAALVLPRRERRRRAARNARAQGPLASKGAGDCNPRRSRLPSAKSRVELGRLPEIADVPGPEGLRP